MKNQNLHRGGPVKISFLNLALLLGLAQTSLGQQIPAMPISARQENSLEFEWSQKKVLESKRLGNSENFDGWQHKGAGSLSVSHEKYHSGHASLLIKSPTKTASTNRGRAMGIAGTIYNAGGEDWSQWNRISFWIYPDLPGFKTVSLNMVFHNDGTEKVPDVYNRNGYNYQLLENHKWNKVYWEIAHLGRDKVTGIELRYRLQGNERGAADSVKYYIDDVVLEKVKPDQYEGWKVSPGHIAYNQLGYIAGMPKTALISDTQVKDFSIIDASTEKVILKKAVSSDKNHLENSLRVMDFSGFDQPGTYILKAGNVQTKPFKIGRFDEVYLSPVIKTINFFYSERCGDSIPGIHTVCHADWTCVHDDQSLPNNGGWHDAGDLSQGLVNTSEAAYAMLTMAEKLRNSNPGVSKRILEEAKWGLDWMLKTRFGDGYRSVWSVMDSWTDGIKGNVDDVSSRAQNNPLANFLAAKTEAKAAVVLKNSDADLAQKALKSAEEDWSFATEGARRRPMSIEMVSAALNASLDLYEATQKDQYKNAALTYGDFILKCQQQNDLAADVPFKGFFYTNPDKRSILHYSHAGHEQSPVMGLVGLCKLFPDDSRKKDWENALRLYADYYKKISVRTNPYYMLPAGIYDLENTRDSTEKEQIKKGFRLNDRYYLKNFPAWAAFRGNNGTTLSQAKGLSTIAVYLKDKDLLALCGKQLNWQFGMNPFCQSLMYGEGYRFAAQYSAMSGNLTGSLPVGIQTHFDRDEPYWPAENCYNWKETWVHPSSRLLWLMADFFNAD